MAKKTKAKPNLIIDPKTFEDFVWMSYRYCIGRKSIAACCHADTIRKIIADNPGIISDERLGFEARDIRDRITDCLNWKPNVHIDGSSYGLDVYSNFLYQLNDHQPADSLSYEFDARSLRISYTEPLKEKVSSWETPDSDYTDLVPWVKLANWMDKSCHKRIVTEYNGKTNEFICYPFPRQIRYEDGRVEYRESWSGVDKAGNFSMCSYVAEEYIKEIKEL